MKLIRDNLKKKYRSAHEKGRSHVYRRPYIVPVLGLLMGVAIVGGVFIAKGSQVLRPSASHVVFLRDSGKEKTLDTKAATVADLIKKLPLNLIPEDVVEPSLDTPIVQDNFRINVYRARPVTVIDGTNRKVTLTAQRSARVVAEDAGMVIYPEDTISFMQGSIANNVIGEEVTIDRATPVSFVLYGTPLTVRTHTKTVADMLREKGVKLDSKDTLKPALATPITDNLEVSIVRNGVHTVTVEVPIDFSTQYIDDSSLSFGATATRQSGVPGKKAVTYQVDVEGGVEVSRVAIQESIIQLAVPKIIAVGTIVDIGGDKTGIMTAAGISPQDYAFADYIISHESGWCYTKWQGQVGYCPATYSPVHDAYTSYGYGLCQATPPAKMSSAGSDWATNPITQLRWCIGYATGRYGNWYSAYEHWLYHHNW